MKYFALDLINQKCNDMAVLIATHEMATALRADYIYILNNGEITDSGSPQTLLTQKNQLSQAYDQIKNFSQ